MAEDSRDNEDGDDSEDKDGDEAMTRTATTEPRTAHRASGVTTSRGGSAKFVRVSDRIYIHGDKEP